MARILLTGGNGFVGRSLIRNFALTNHEIYSWDRTIDGDFIDPINRTIVFSKFQPEKVVHLAWPNLQQINYMKSEVHNHFSKSTQEFIETCIEKNVQFISLGTVFEKDKIEKNNDYQIAKSKISNFIRTLDVDLLTWIVPSYIFSFKEKKPGVLNQFTNSTSKTTEVLKNPYKIQNWIEVRDVAATIEYAIDSNLHGVYNLESKHNMRVIDFVQSYMNYKQDEELIEIKAKVVAEVGNQLNSDEFTSKYLGNFQTT